MTPFALMTPFAFLFVIPQGSASSFAVAVAFAFAVAFAVAFDFVVVIASAVASSFASALALASEIGPGFSPDNQPLSNTRALAPGTLSSKPA